MRQEREGIVFGLLTKEEQDWLRSGPVEYYSPEHKWIKYMGSDWWSSVAYRRARPTPAKRYRPWTPEEALGQKVRDKETGALHLINWADADEDMTAYLEYWTQLSGEPCGVEVER